MGVPAVAGAWPRVLRAATVVAFVAAGCSATAVDLEMPEVLANATTPTAALPTATGAPTATAVPLATPTPAPTPTPLPTPTPVPGPIIPDDVLRSSIEENFALLDELGAQYTFTVHADGVGVLDERRPVLELLPASNQKIVTAFGAMELLPPDFRFRTQVVVDDDLNVAFVGGGDPTLDRGDIRRLADELLVGLGGSPADDEHPGVTVEIGDLIIDPTYFDSTRTGPGWPDRYIPVDVGPMSGLMIDKNQHRGDAAYLADPDEGNAELIADILATAGVVVQGEVRVGPAPADAGLIAEHESPWVRSLVSRTLSVSDNEISEALVRQIALDYVGTSDILDGKAIIYEDLRGFGIDLGEVDGDGSGLSRRNRLSSRQIVEVLRLATERPWWPTMENGLASAGVGGTLAERLETDTTLDNVQAKTGTLIDVVALSGFFTTVDGVSVVFSFVVNSDADQRDDARDAMDQIIVAHASATLDQLVD